MSEMPEKGLPDQGRDVPTETGNIHNESPGLQAWMKAGDFEKPGDESRQALGDGKSLQALARVQAKELEVVEARQAVGDAMEACRQLAQTYHEADRNLLNAYKEISRAKDGIGVEFDKLMDSTLSQQESGAQIAVNVALVGQEEARLAWRDATLNRNLAEVLQRGKATEASYYGTLGQVARLDTSFGVEHSPEGLAKLAQSRSQPEFVEEVASRRVVSYKISEEDYMTMLLEREQGLAEAGRQLLAEQGLTIPVDDVNFIGDALGKALAKFTEAIGDFDWKKDPFEVAQGALQEQVDVLKRAIDAYEGHGLSYAQAREQLQASGGTYVSAGLERVVRESDPQKIAYGITEAGKMNLKDRIKLEMRNWAAALRQAAFGR
jgi:hypothetical protein